MKGDTPYVFRGGQTDGKRVLKSKRDYAIIKSITIPPGYGVVPSGQIMGIITESTSRKGMYVPRCPRTPAAGQLDVAGAAYITAAPSTYYHYVTMEDSYKFAIGDHVAIADSGTTGEDLGAITAIDRTTYTHIAMITVTNSISGSFAVSRGAWLFIQSKTTAGYDQSQGVLLGAVDTGSGENAQGGDGALVVKNAEFYESGLVNYDSDVATDLSSSDLGDTIAI